MQHIYCVERTQQLTHQPAMIHWTADNTWLKILDHTKMQGHTAQCLMLRCVNMRLLQLTTLIQRLKSLTFHLTCGCTIKLVNHVHACPDPCHAKVTSLLLLPTCCFKKHVCLALQLAWVQDLETCDPQFDLLETLHVCDPLWYVHAVYAMTCAQGEV